MIEEIIFAGFGGQGILLGGGLIAQAAMQDGLYATWFPSYGPEMRGGTCNCLIAYSDDEIGSPIFSACDTALIMNQPSLEKFASQVRKGGSLFVNTSLIESKDFPSDVQVIEVPVNELAREAGADRAANVVMVAAFSAVRQRIKHETLQATVRTAFAKKGDSIVEINLKALDAGRRAVTGVTA